MSVGSGLHVNMSLVPVSGGANALHDPAAPEGLSTLARQAIGGLIEHHEAVAGLSAPLDQQLQAADAGPDRRLLGELGPRQPLQHVPGAGRAGSGDAHREPHAVRHGQPVPRRRGDAQRGPARRRRRHRLRRPADRRRRRRAEHRPPHAAHARRGARRRRARQGDDRGDGPRARAHATSRCAATTSPGGRPPASRGTPRWSRPGSSTATCRSTDRRRGSLLDDGTRRGPNGARA